MAWLTKRFKRGQLLSSADQLVCKRDHSEAIKLYKQVIELDPKYTPAYLLQTISHYELGEFDQALEVIDRGIAIQDDNAIFHLAKGEVLHAKKDYEIAQVSLDKAYELSPDNPRIAYYLAVNLIWLGKTDQALPYFEQAAREDRDIVLARLLTIGETLLSKQSR